MRCSWDSVLSFGGLCTRQSILEECVELSSIVIISRSAGDGICLEGMELSSTPPPRELRSLRYIEYPLETISLSYMLLVSQVSVIAIMS